MTCHFLYVKHQLITKVIFILSFISIGLEFSSVNNTSIYEKSKLKVFKNIEFLDNFSNNQPNDLLGTNEYKTLESR